MIYFSKRGNFEKLDEYFKKAKSATRRNILEKYGQMGVEALAEATPKDTGLTANSWSYDIYTSKNKIQITWKNSNMNEEIPIAVLLQYGHATKNGGFVEGIDYINPAMRPIFESLANAVWKEVSEVK